jgi:hypothetical protein
MFPNTGVSATTTPELVLNGIRLGMPRQDVERLDLGRRVSSHTYSEGFSVHGSTLIVFFRGIPGQSQYVVGLEGATVLSLDGVFIRAYSNRSDFDKLTNYDRPIIGNLSAAFEKLGLLVTIRPLDGGYQILSFAIGDRSLPYVD